MSQNALPQPIAERKSQLRRSLLDRRRSIDRQQWRDRSELLCDRLARSPVFAEARTVLGYFSFRQEPDLSPLFADRGRRWGFPRCVGRSLHWHHYQPGDRLDRGAYGILEPSAEAAAIAPEEVDLILVPAVACDERGYRLGYGGGFYDRLLADPRWQQKPTIAIVFDFAIFPELPIEAWDLPLQGVCSEKQFRGIG
ncbi:5-formyltetrahydrofolate cyclo-ligase [Oxynema aestuarii]|uniref:5-formyltetrahydrofolate cyclo-ligase n=1 Tax=Oxynema aestuarii AP17 TaxID=2064643 RepID=A0A6H1U4A9_9CYAN|nr:5-formyltetrahydrofolate cyclo-ligase [Oxynema aestuarii]QIZ72459.1 5-formyltetrahydrofolate cyclo-ligase [Oxynema aestuarii AP17]